MKIWRKQTTDIIALFSLISVLIILLVWEIFICISINTRPAQLQQITKIKYEGEILSFCNNEGEELFSWCIEPTATITMEISEETRIIKISRVKGDFENGILCYKFQITNSETFRKLPAILKEAKAKFVCSYGCGTGVRCSVYNL